MKQVKKIKMIVGMTAILILLTAFSGCTTPGTDFDVVKVVASITRNGGDYTITPTGESGYDMHVVIGTLSIEALGMEVNQQEIKNLYKESTNNRLLYYRAINGGGILGRINGWWQRINSEGSIKFNSVTDLAQATDTGQFFGTSLPDFKEIGAIDYLARSIEDFSLSNGTYRIPDFGLGIYSAKLPRESFLNNKPEAGYLVLNDPDKSTFNGITVKVNDVVTNRNTAFVIWDTSDYWVVVLTNEPAFMTDDSMKVFTVSLTLIKPNLDNFVTSYYNNANDYFTAYGFGMEQQLRSSTTSLVGNIENAIDTAITEALNVIPGGGLVKSFDSISEFFSGPETKYVDRLEMQYFMSSLLTMSQNKDTIFKNSWSAFGNKVNNVRHIYQYFEDGVNINDGISGICEPFTGSSGRYTQEWEMIHKAFFGYDRWIFPRVDPLFNSTDRETLNHLMNQDNDNFLSDNGLSNFYRLYSSSGARVPFSVQVYALQIVDDSFLGIFDTSTMKAMKSIFDLNWDDKFRSVTLEDFEEFRTKFESGITTTIETLIPDKIGEAITDLKADVGSEFAKINEQLKKLNVQIYAFEVQLSDMKVYLKTLIPETPKVSIFAYQIPTPVFSKIVGQTGDFLQADPTTSFSAAVTLSIGDPSNYSLVSGYPRAVIVTQSKGTSYIPLQADLFDTYALRQDMIEMSNLTVGDTVKTYFEVMITNGTNNISAKTGVYYTRVVRSWVADTISGMSLIIDNLSATNEQLQAAINFLSNTQSPFSAGNESALDSFYATLEVRNDKGEELYILSPRKTFKMTEVDSEVLSWEVGIYKNKPYTLSITLGNSTTDVIIRYTTTINSAKASWLKPLSWGVKVRELLD